MPHRSASAPRPHLESAPERSFWEDTLFFGRFDEVLAAGRGTKGIEKLLAESFRGGSTAAVVEGVIGRAGGGHEARLNLALVGAFTEMKHSEAIEVVAAAALEPDLVDANRTPGGKVRRHALMALLYERDPLNLLSVDLWHRHLGRRRTRYRLKAALDDPLVFDPKDTEAAARRVLSRVQALSGWGCKGFDEVRVVPCLDAGEVLVALREWPGRTTGRDRKGDVQTIDLPDWTVLHLAEGADCLEVSDRRVDRGSRFAGELVRELAGADVAYELVLQELSSRKLDEFLDRITSPGDTIFPLVEIVAEVPWRPHRCVTLTGTPRYTAEDLVDDMRRLHYPFARDWRTVKQVKLRFEDKYKILVHFPPPGHPQALTFSDVDRSSKVTARFRELLKAHLHVEVASKARRGTALPARKKEAPPRKGTERWWSAVLSPKTDAPAEWLEPAVRAVEAEGLVKTEWCRAFRCGSPYIDRRAVRVDSLDCEGEVELPMELPDADDPHREEVDGDYWCSEGDHRWEPVRYGLPTSVRLRVRLDHRAAWARLLTLLAHYGDVRELPARPGVAVLRLDHAELHLVYVPLVQEADELDPGSFGKKAPVAWVRAPGESPPGLPDGTVDLAAVLADPACLAEAWGGVALKRRRSPATVERAPMVLRDGSVPATGSITRLIEITDTAILLDGHHVAGPGHRAYLVLDALRQAAAGDEADGRVREAKTWQQLDELLLPDQRGGDVNAWRTWVSRTRDALAEAVGDRDIRMRVIVTRSGAYRLGDGYAVVDRRLQAAADD